MYVVTSPSTGEMVKMFSPRARVCVCVSGCGGYADNKVGAVSTTGHGEAIMRVTLARLILFHMEQGRTTHTLADSE